MTKPITGVVPVGLNGAEYEGSKARKVRLIRELCDFGKVPFRLVSDYWAQYGPVKLPKSVAVYCGLLVRDGTGLGTSPAKSSKTKGTFQQLI